MWWAAQIRNFSERNIRIQCSNNYSLVTPEIWTADIAFLETVASKTHRIAQFNSLFSYYAH